MKTIKVLLTGLIMAAAMANEKTGGDYKVINVRQKPKKKAKLQSVKNHKSKPSNKYKGSKPIKMQTRKSNHKRT